MDKWTNQQVQFHQLEMFLSRIHPKVEVNGMSCYVSFLIPIEISIGLDWIGFRKNSKAVVFVVLPTKTGKYVKTLDGGNKNEHHNYCYFG